MTTMLNSVFTLAAVVGAAACASRPDDSSTPKLVIGSLDIASYTAMVQPIFERRCGSIDCHGQLPRGLRVYGETGLRLPNDAGLVPGGGATTPAEALATYQSIIGLQPELMNDFLLTQPRTEAGAYTLLILTKGTAIERHRGGPALLKGEPAEQCIVTWLEGNTNASTCAVGAVSP